MLARTLIGVALVCVLAHARTAIVEARPKTKYVRNQEGLLVEFKTMTAVGCYRNVVLDPGEYLDVEVRTRGNRAILAILGPVGHEPSQLLTDEEVEIANTDPETGWPLYYWAKSGNLVDWLVDASGRGLVSAVSTAIEEGCPEILRVGIKGLKFIAGSTQPNGLLEVGAEEAAGALLDVAGYGAAKAIAAFIIGGVAGAASSERGEVGIVLIDILDNRGLTCAQCAASDPSFDGRTKFRINSPLWHPYGNYTVVVIAVGEDLPGAESMTTFDIMDTAWELSAELSIPVVNDYDSKRFPLSR